MSSTLPLVGLCAVGFVVLVTALNDRFHAGVAGLLLAFILGTVGGLGFSDVAARFPGQLFITLLAVTLLFQMAEANGALSSLAGRLLRLCRGHRKMIPLVLFLGPALMTALGVGNIAAVAIIAPIAMNIGRTVGLRPFLVTLLVVGGANAAALSPLSMAGVIAHNLLLAYPEEANVTGGLAAMRIFATMFAVQSLCAAGGFFGLGGSAWLRSDAVREFSGEAPIPPTASHRATLLLLALFVALAIAFSFESILPEILRGLASQVGFVALLVASLMMLLRLAPTEKAIAGMPWSTLLLIVGMFTLVAVVEATGGVALTTELLRRPGSAAATAVWTSLAAGGLSAFSSSSGVVMPLFLPMVPGIAHAGPAGFASFLALTIIVSAHLVDTSPLSSLGALCLASTIGERERAGLFRQLLIWSLTMVPLGAVLAYLAFILSTR